MHQIFGVLRKEIPFEQDGDTVENLGVNAVAVKNTVTSHPAGCQLAGKPCHSAPLPPQLFFNGMSDMDTLCHVAFI